MARAREGRAGLPKIASMRSGRWVPLRAMSGQSVRTRFAPSPTGRLHMGNVRTALFNFLAARAGGGDFLIRSEDTDSSRSEERWLIEAMSELAWLGMDWDEGPDRGGARGPYRQSERAEIYARALDRLKSAGAAYPCFRTEEELADHRRAQIAAGRPPRYDREWARLDGDEVRRREAAGHAPVWRFSVPSGRTLAWQDLLRGPQQVSSDEIADFILVRSDGSPGFMFGNALDDALMGISHVLRGEDHTSNTPRQLMILEALGLEAPRYGHLSLVVSPEGQPLSKRAGSEGLADLRGEGYLASAVANYLARLGHGLDGDDPLDMRGLAAGFDVGRLSTSPARFDHEQLDHWQHKAVMAAQDSELADWAGDGLAPVPASDRADFLELVRPNVQRPEELAFWARCLYGSDRIEPSAGNREVLEVAGPAFFSAAAAQAGGGLDAIATGVREATGAKGRALFLPLRVALTGQGDGPELRPMLALMPEAKVRERFERWSGAADDPGPANHRE